MLPFQGLANPYLTLLAGALEEAGVDVSLAPLRGSLPLLRLVRQYGRPDVIHLHWHHRLFVPKSGSPAGALSRTALSLQQLALTRVSGTRLVWTVHNIVNHERRHAGLELRACRLLARLVDRIVVHCEEAAIRVAEAYRIPRTRIEVVPHGHYRDWYSGAGTRENARRQLGLPADALVLLHFGQIRAYKGVHRLLEDFGRLRGDALRLLVVGEPRSDVTRRQLAALAEADRRVATRLEFVPDDELATYLRACDAAVLPYADSLTSGAAVLAASFGRPVVGPRLGCLADFPSEAAILYDPNESEGLLVALQQAVTAPLGDMGESAQRWIEQYRWSGVAARLIEVYESVLGRRPEAVAPVVG